MNTYFSTFHSGLQEIVRKYLNDFNDLEVIQLLDGLVVFNTSKNPNHIVNLPVFNNSFLLIKSLDFEKNQSPNSTLRNLSKDHSLNIKQAVILLKKRGSFRIIISKQNTLVSVDKNLLTNLEQKIEKATKLNVNRSKPDLEFWLITRSEGRAYFGLRFTKHKDYKKVLAKGQLRPEIAFFMVYLANPGKKDVVLDPFVGYGSIPVALVKYFRYQKLIAIDKDSRMIEKLKSRLGRASVLIETQDALNLSKIQKGSVSKIITDPPWGYYSKIKDIDSFYKKMLASFFRILKKNGFLIILIGNRELFEEVVSSSEGVFKMIEKHYILVSGKKAAIYKLQKV